MPIGNVIAEHMLLVHVGHEQLQKNSVTKPTVGVHVFARKTARRETLSGYYPSVETETEKFWHACTT